MPEIKTQSLYELLSERESFRVKSETSVRNTRWTDLTIDEILQMRHCFDGNAYLNAEDVLKEILKRAGL